MTKTRRGMTAKAAAEQVMEEAYMLASAGNTLPAAARQIMYAARPKIQELTGEPLSDKYFTQYLLPDYINEHEPDWDVTFDAGGHFTEPHTEYEIAMGTLEVRAYLNEVGDPEFRCGEFKTGKIETVGPEANFGALMYVEKEGFAPLWQRSKIAERHDIAIMSNKGNSVTAGRRLADEICHHYGIPLVVLRDFDVAGFTIVDLFRRSTRRYQFENDITVIDLGLRLADCASAI